MDVDSNIIISNMTATSSGALPVNNTPSTAHFTIKPGSSSEGSVSTSPAMKSLSGFNNSTIGFPDVLHEVTPLQPLTSIVDLPDQEDTNLRHSVVENPDGLVNISVKKCSNKSSEAGFRRVTSYLHPAIQHQDMPRSKDLRRVSSLAALPVMLDKLSTLVDSQQDMRKDGLGQVLKVRFFIDTKEEDAFATDCQADKNVLQCDKVKNNTTSRLSSFRDMFRSSIRRKDTNITGEKATDTNKSADIFSASKKLKKNISGNNIDDVQDTSGDSSSEHIPDPDSDSIDERYMWSRFGFRHSSYNFQRSQSTKSRLKPLTEEDDIEEKKISHSVTEGNFLYRSTSFMLRHLQLRATCDSWFHGQRYNVVCTERPDHQNQQNLHEENNQSRYVEGEKHYNDSNKNYPKNIRTRIFGMLDNRHGHDRSQRSLHRFTSPERGSSRKLIGHSLASVELGSWAAKGSRRGSTLQPFCTTLSPTEASSRSEILQTVSSSIIHLFQRKPLKENELGILQEHVRFLINSEAGGLVHEYYKDQLLRKGMIILREKIKNEQGVELLKQLGETWNYFFKEILPTLQAVLYPLASLLGKDETVRSLSLLAFRNIVVLKVSIKEALDAVEKHSYPPSIKQMLLVLQSIQDNVFLSENQFLLEKLVARAVCPYLGQRGVYEGSPDPVIKVKLKLPIIIPTLVVSEDRFPAKSRQKLDYQTYSSPLSLWKGGPHDSTSSSKKLKPVLEHVFDAGRRHSIIS